MERQINESGSYFLAHCTVALFLCHDDEIIMVSSSLNKQPADQWRDKSMGVAHIFVLIHGDYVFSLIFNLRWMGV
jgi:hypothetical protein